jgi:hypothetical protein
MPGGGGTLHGLLAIGFAADRVEALPRLFHPKWGQGPENSSLDRLGFGFFFRGRDAKKNTVSILPALVGCRVTRPSLS